MPSCRNSYLTQEAKKQDEFRRLATRRAGEGFQENTVSRRIHERSTRPEAGLTRVKSSGEKKRNVAKIFKPHYLWPLCYCWPGILLLLCLQSQLWLRQHKIFRVPLDLHLNFRPFYNIGAFSLRSRAMMSCTNLWLALGVNTKFVKCNLQQMPGR